MHGRWGSTWSPPELIFKNVVLEFFESWSCKNTAKAINRKSRNGETRHRGWWWWWARGRAAESWCQFFKLPTRPLTHTNIMTAAAIAEVSSKACAGGAHARAILQSDCYSIENAPAQTALSKRPTPKFWPKGCCARWIQNLLFFFFHW